MRGSKTGSWVGVIAGLVFVMVNAAGLPDPWTVALRAAGVVAAVVSSVVITRAPVVDSEPSRRAVRVYGWSVTAMIVAIPVGASLLNGPLDAPELTVVWVVAVVGAHFLPFAAAFDAPVFGPLALTLMTTAAVGAGLTLLTEGDGAAAATAVTAGFVLLAFAALGARVPTSGSGRSRPTPE